MEDIKEKDQKNLNNFDVFVVVLDTKREDIIHFFGSKEMIIDNFTLIELLEEYAKNSIFLGNLRVAQKAFHIANFLDQEINSFDD